MRLESPEFDEGGRIPRRFTCQGEDVSPRLLWTDVPEGAAELALTCTDPDAPVGVFVHWVMWGMAPGASGLAEGEVPAGAHRGRNDFGGRGYRGPCPPPGHGTHHYHFRLYALGEGIVLVEGATSADLQRAVKGKVLAEAELIGTYER
jgi:Raf kinase inhibitor-like YbhB/YbcL family protein